MSITLKLEKFEGPLDLLLELIEAEKLEISEVALSEVTDQYLDYVRDIQDLAIAELADFLVVAAQLLLIKSRSLLPSLRLNEEEQAEIADLQQALLEYQRYKRAAQEIARLAQNQRFIVTRPLWAGAQSTFSPPSNIDLGMISQALRNVIQDLARFTKPLDQAVVRRVISLEEKIKKILKRLEKKATTTLKELSPSKEKMDIILAFLAVLFLFKEKLVHLLQPTLFGEIKVTKNHPRRIS